MKLNVGEIIRRIKEATGLGEEFIKERIKAKREELYGLVSEEGAALIVANELGVKISRGEEIGRLQIKNLVKGLRNVNVFGRVIRIFGSREFEKEKLKGKVISFLIGDETGVIRVVAWNQLADLIEKNLKVNDIVEIIRGSVKEDSLGRRELHLTKGSKLKINPQIDFKLPEAEKLKQRAEYSLIERLEEGGEYKVVGTITKLLGINFYKICPYCERVVKENSCALHGQISPSYSFALSFILDDGTGSIRVSIFGEQAEKLLGVGAEQIMALVKGKEDLLKHFGKIIGKEIIVIGKAERRRENLELRGKKIMVKFSPILEAFRIVRVLKYGG
ncbi:MAG: OB-fold nucleic acid binding domain-containing protein [Candidatus Nanoarchaeia archaeon]|nr:OB-fold nucleic acid binding domain-containing protein [Candidatus Haiyanarchaeum thermophilum]MCW1303250.1 OB-fold nucleic acid binding domain-containing protein [Candidatus Haiyanarchaeum thermophilum]MCW1304018.1 OB-fold nucleic acid binding domain-containing protein [Candidatus Haiyanarchaeum thermophilum]MCW1306410.1 OB-fold nucleic acid binding domain-containing protein [Candidatus Haiyanarchaeum thermophilum]MCW1307292.1 OB-fold nucleic acid binding domain-containing protein [Candidat